MLDFCLLHYLLSSDSEAIARNPYRFGSAIQVFPSDIGEYLSSFLSAVVVVFILFSFYNWKKNVFFDIVNSFVRKKVYFVTYLYDATSLLLPPLT